MLAVRPAKYRLRSNKEVEFNPSDSNSRLRVDLFDNLIALANQFHNIVDK